MKNEIIAFLLRSPAVLLEKLRQSADENQRSVNGEIIHRLMGSFKANRKRKPQGDQT